MYKIAEVMIEQQIQRNDDEDQKHHPKGKREEDADEPDNRDCRSKDLKERQHDAAGTLPRGVNRLVSSLDFIKLFTVERVFVWHGHAVSDQFSYESIANVIHAHAVVAAEVGER